MPFALTVVRNTGGGDQNLWYTVWDAEKGEWGEQSEFNDNLSRSGPALAQHGDKLYCVHRGQDNDENLYWTVYTTNDGWSDDHPMTGHLTTTTPCLVEFKGDLYCFHRGQTGDERLYGCKLSSDGQSWTDEFKIQVGNEDHSSDSGCAAAVLNGKLYMVYEGCYKSHLHVISSDDGRTWGDHKEFTDYTTADTPALVVYNNQLLLVHRGSGTNTRLYSMTSHDGISWSTDESLGDYWSNQGPALAVFKDKVYMVHRSDKNAGELWYSIYDGNSWTPDTHIVGQSTGETPALACYTDPQCDPENYVDASTATPQLICVHRGWG